MAGSGVTRRGHGRPVGSLTRPQRFEWHGDRPPKLGDVAFQTAYEGGDPAELERAFLLVGVEETSSRLRPYRLIFERLEWDATAAADWTFYNVPRR